MKWLRIGELAEEYGVSTQTIRNWERAGMFSKVVRTKGGHRRFMREAEGETRKTVIYARVSSNEQKNDLKRQTEELKEYCERQQLKEVEVLEDIGSGINYKKRGLKKLIKEIVEGKVGKVIIGFKDRLLRFGTEILEQLCALKDVEIVTLFERQEKSFEYRLSEDVLSILTVYSSRIYGMRSHRKRKECKATKGAVLFP